LTEFLSLVTCAFTPEENPGDPRLYLQAVSWNLKLMMCGIPSWRWRYLGEVPLLPDLLLTVPHFDSIFDPDEPIPRFAWWIMRNGMRTYTGMPPAIVRLKSHPVIGRYFNSPDPIHLDSFLAVYEREIEGNLEGRMAALNAQIPRIQYARGVPPQHITVPIYKAARSSDAPLVEPCAVGEAIVYMGMVGKIVKDRGDGTYDVQVQKVRVPPIDDIIRDDYRQFASIRDDFAEMEVDSQHFRVMGKIIGDIKCGGSNYGLQLTTAHPRGDGSFLKEGRLGMVSIQSNKDGFETSSQVGSHIHRILQKTPKDSSGC
jgi:hypothetical protein